MTAKNDVTGDSIKSRGSSDSYRSNYARIFGKKSLQTESKYDKIRSEMVKKFGEAPVSDHMIDFILNWSG